MMGTLATVLAGKKIPTPEDRYWADVEGDIENVNNVLKITQIRATYHLKVPKGKVGRGPSSLLLVPESLPCGAERDWLYCYPGRYRGR